MPEAQSGADILARIKPRFREETTTLCLRPDLLEEWERLDQELAETRVADSTSGRLAGGSSAGARKLAERIQELEAEIEATQVRFTMRAMPNHKWRALCDNHPPRKGNDLDSYSGYNRDAVNDEAVRVCLVDPVFDDASWAQFLEVCNPSEWQELRATVNRVNKSVVDAPKSVLASQTLAKRARGSKQPEATE